MSKLQTCDACKKPNEYCEFLIFESAEKKSTVWLCETCMTDSRRVWVDFFKNRDPGISRPSGPDLPALTDDSIMYMGEFKGQMMKNVPASRLLWYADQDWIEHYPRLLRYINANRQALEEDAALEKQEKQNEA